MELDRIYTELIMEHNKSNHNKRELEKATHVERGHNPNCGDDLTIQLDIEEGVIKDSAFAGVGCAISTASASILMDIIKGRKVDEVQGIVDSFLKMIKKEDLNQEERNLLGDSIFLENISNMPARVKCATLAWNGVRVALEKEEQ
ncbi:iron-sulfur cluster assembly scaffold protein NifU [Propionigenium maris DSM 9537]|uniref:Iron-sulfur cluster assembly scaffold protein NifU n=1 Tax=Propionigenium maris DSM 9537 TaxID=1123000 RepID=A0A9W6LPS6_9FUSO|nr:SUF system NifU family Fe-S cluster assembly protein [Propionigenium maris]GLI58369.1 iron-sulfur cluster assembly scaffold protein NifU [Propionigenium maris DSM 9537]